MWWCGLTGADPAATTANQVFQDEAAVKQYHKQCSPNMNYDVWKQALNEAAKSKSPKTGGGIIGDDFGAY